MSSEYEIITGTQPYAKDLGVEMKRTDTQTLIDAMRILARDVQCDDGVANAAIAEAADRLEELLTALKAIVKHQDEVGGTMAQLSATRNIATRAINGKQVKELQ